MCTGPLNEGPGNNFAWLLRVNIAVGAGSSDPVVTFSDRNLVCTQRGRRVRAFLDIQVLQGLRCRHLPAKSQAVLHGDPDFLRPKILDTNLVLDWAVILRDALSPSQAQVWIGRFVHERNALVSGFAGVAIEFP